MADIQNFIQTATGSLGISQDTALSATGGLFGFLGDRLPGDDFEALLGELPGTSDVVEGKLGVATGVVGSLTSGGLEVRQVASFITEFLIFAETNVDGELLDRVLTQVPDIRNVIG